MAEDFSAFQVPAALDRLGEISHRWRRYGISLGRLESRVLRSELDAVPLQMPIYICGLARSGTTILHHVVCARGSLATHRVRDFPLLWTPFWWRKATARLSAAPPRERPHADGIAIDQNSPDSLEEMVWMAFFPRCHDPEANAVLDGATSYPAFESFYRDHLRKILLSEGATRYAAKANYHVARLSYLLRVFPGARFLIVVRDPADHVASLVRQHRRFSAGQRGNRAALDFMRRSGHFEFGLDRRPMNLGDGARVRAIQRAWAAGEEVRGWARYWAVTYDHLHAVLATDPAVRRAAHVVRFESLCATPEAEIRAALDHCRIDGAERVAAEFTPRVRRPEYDSVPFTPAERDAIRDETAATAARWGY